MKSVIERLDDIENTARSIVAKAEEDKSQVEQEIQAQRDQFDKELDEKTQAELTRIREDGKRQVDELLKSQREKNHEAVQTADLRRRSAQCRQSFLHRLTMRLFPVLRMLCRWWNF